MAVCVCPFFVFLCMLLSAALPHYKLFETQAQLIVVTEEFGIRWDLIQKDLRHLQRALCKTRRRETKTRMQGWTGRERKAKQRKEGPRLFKHQETGRGIRAGCRARTWPRHETGKNRNQDLPSAWPTSTKTLHMLPIWLPFV